MNTKEVLDQLDVVLNTIDANDESLGNAVATFLTEQIIDQDDPSSFKLALQYAQWALTHQDLAAGRSEATHRCRCLKGTGWIFDPHDPTAVRPCDRKNCGDPSRIDFWHTTFVNSDQPPR